MRSPARDGLWVRWGAALSSVPTWTPPVVPTLVVAPHPDDEVIACGGLVARQRSRGATVRVVAVTDGEAAYPSSVSPDGLAVRRRGEQVLALEALGVEPRAVRRLGLPDSEVAEHEDELTEALVDHAVGFRLIVAPWIHDRHPDHEAVGRAALRAGSILGIDVVQTVFWGWLGPRELFLGGDPVRLPLTEVERRRRLHALSAHRSQLDPSPIDPAVTPVLGPAELEPLGWPNEYFLRGRQ